MPKIPRIKPKPKPSPCKICASPQRNAINQRIVKGDSIMSIAKDFGCCRLTMMRHAGIGNDKNGNPHKAHYVSQVLVAKARMDGKAGLDLMACAEEIYLDCKDNADKAKKNAGTSRDFRDASGCWDPATKALGLLKIEEKPPVPVQTTTINFSKFTDEELKTYELLGRKLEGSEEGESEKASD